MNCNIHFFCKVIARFWKGIATLDFKGAGHVYPNLKINVESTLNVECNPFVPAVHIKFVWMNIVSGNIQKAEILGYWIFGKKNWGTGNYHLIIISCCQNNQKLSDVRALLSEELLCSKLIFIFDIQKMANLAETCDLSHAKISSF